MLASIFTLFFNGAADNDPDADASSFTLFFDGFREWLLISMTLYFYFNYITDNTYILYNIFYKITFIFNIVKYLITEDETI